MALLLMTIGGCPINGYLWLFYNGLVVVLLIIILLMIVLLMIIGGCPINGYW